MATPLHFVLEQVLTLFKSTWPTRISTKCLTARYSSECFSLLWSVLSSVVSLPAAEELLRLNPRAAFPLIWVALGGGFAPTEYFSLKDQCWGAVNICMCSLDCMTFNFCRGYLMSPTVQLLSTAQELALHFTLLLRFKNSVSEKEKAMKHIRQWQFWDLKSFSVAANGLIVLLTGVGGLFSLGLEITMNLFVQCSLQIPHSSAFPFMSIRSL